MKLRIFAVLLVGLALGFVLAQGSEFFTGAQTVSAQTTATASSSIPIYSPDGAQLTGLHLVFGRVNIDRPGLIEVKFDGAAVFKDNNYSCHTTQPRPGPVDSGIQKIDGARFAVLGGGRWVTEFLCIGQ